jgi:hypothetical protein
MRRILILILLCCPIPSHARNWKCILRTTAEHVSLGAGVEIGIAQAAGGPHKYAAGLLAAGAVAGFKEGADAVAGRDTKKQAIWHAFSVMAGAGIAASVRH